MTSHSRPFCHGPQLPAPGLLFTPEQPHGSGHRHFSAGMGRASGVCISAFRPHSPSLEQASNMLGDSSDPHCPVLAAKGVVSGAPESLSGSSGAPFLYVTICSNSPTFVVCTRTFTCCTFMHGDCTVIRLPLRPV